MHEYDDNIDIYYDPLHFVTNNFTELLAGVKLKKISKVIKIRFSNSLLIN